MVPLPVAGYLGRPMGIVLTVLEPPHPPEPNLVAALPSGAGRVIDVEPRLVSPRYDKLIVTTRGLLVRDHVTGDFHGVPWANFSVDAHLRQHSRHATLLLWLNERRPLELAITRRVALNIAMVAPVLKLNPTAAVDDIVIVDPPSDVVDLSGPARIDAPAPQPSDRVNDVPPPVPAPPGGRRGGRNSESQVPAQQPTSPGDSGKTTRLVVGVALLVLAGAAGGIASIVINTDGSSADGAVPAITSEAVQLDPFDP